MCSFDISFGGNFVFTEGSAAVDAPRQDVVPFVDPSAVVTGFEEMPDGVVILI